MVNQQFNCRTRDELLIKSNPWQAVLRWCPAWSINTCLQTTYSTETVHGGNTKRINAL